MDFAKVLDIVATEWPDIGDKLESLEVWFYIRPCRHCPTRGQLRLHYHGYRCDSDPNGNRTSGSHVRSPAHRKRGNSRPDACFYGMIPQNAPGLAVTSPDGSAQPVVARSTVVPDPDQAAGSSELETDSQTGECATRHPCQKDSARSQYQQRWAVV